MDFRLISYIASRILAFRKEANYAELRITEDGKIWIWASDATGHWAWGTF